MTRLPEGAVFEVSWTCGGCGRRLARSMDVGGVKAGAEVPMAIACPWCDPDIAAGLPGIRWVEDAER